MSKKALVVSPYYPPHIGGLESFADELNQCLVKNDFEVRVLAPRLPKESLEREIYNRIEVWRYPAWEIIPNYPIPSFWNKECREIIKKVLSEKYDWVISHTRFFLTSFLAGIWARKRNTKWLHIEHGSDFVKLNSFWKSWLAKMFDYTLGKWVLQKADKVVAVSVASADFCKQIFADRKYQVIYRGVDIGKLTDDSEIKDKHKNKIKILFAGRLIDGKGIIDLLKAVEKIKSLNWVLLIAGDGSQKEILMEQANKLRIEDKVIFLGQMKRPDLLGMLKMADIVVNPSYTEGLPTVIVEAAKCGRAIVATDVGGTREIIENNKTGILITPKDIQLLSEKIEMLIKDSSLREKLGKAAKEETNNKFNWEVSIKDYINILK